MHDIVLSWNEPFYLVVSWIEPVVTVALLLFQKPSFNFKLDSGRKEAKHHSFKYHCNCYSYNGKHWCILFVLLPKHFLYQQRICPNGTKQWLIKTGSLSQQWPFHWCFQKKHRICFIHLANWCWEGKYFILISWED